MANNSKRYKCPYCEYRAYRKDLIDHIDDNHEDMIPKGYTSSRVVYNTINKKDHGTCMICHKETKWDDDKQRYDTLCGNPKCKKQYVEMVRSRMVHKYGTYNLLKDPNFQKKMLEGRSISGKYKFEDGGSVGYVGSYEKKFLEFMDKFLHVKSYDIISPGPNIPYTYKGKEHIWITDFLYEPYNLVFDIKDGGDNPNTRDMKEYREKQLAKEKAIAEYGDYNYIRLTDNKFEQLILLIMELKEKDDEKPIIRINESINELHIISSKEDNNMIYENLILNKKDLEINVDKFESGEKNVLLVTGFSGSGKSTLASKLANKYKCINYELDCLDFYLNKYLTVENMIGNEDGLYEFIKHKKLKFGDKSKRGTELYREYIKFLINWCKRQKNKKFIIEGLQIYEIFEDGDTFITSCPIIIKGTSGLLSAIRAAKRNEGSFLKEFRPLVKWALKDNKSLNKLIKSLNESHIEEETRIDDDKVPENIYHISTVNHDGETFEPRYYDNDNVKKDMERRVKRVCFSDSIDGALYSIFPNGAYDIDLFVHVPGNRVKIYKTTSDDIYDSDITHELWVKEPVEMKCIGKIHVSGISNKYHILEVDKDKSGYGKRKYYEPRWNWTEKYNKESIDQINIDESVISQKELIKIIKKLPSAIAHIPAGINKIKSSLKTRLKMIENKDYLSKYKRLIFNKRNTNKYLDQNQSLLNYCNSLDFNEIFGILFVDEDKFVSSITVKKCGDNDDIYIDSTIIADDKVSHGLFSQLMDCAVFDLSANKIIASKNDVTIIDICKKCGFIESETNDDKITMSYNKFRKSSGDHNPVFIVTSYTYGKIPASKLIISYTDSFFSHASISLKPDLSEIYSFNVKKDEETNSQNIKNGCQLETLKFFKNNNSIIRVNCIFLNNTKYNKLVKELNNIHSGKTSYNYSGLLDILTGKESDTDISSMICSQFVCHLFNAAGVKLFDKSENQTTPNDLSRLCDTSDKVYRLYEGNAKDYNVNIMENRLENIKDSVINY